MGNPRHAFFFKIFWKGGGRGTNININMNVALYCPYPASRGYLIGCGDRRGWRWKHYQGARRATKEASNEESSKEVGDKRPKEESSKEESSKESLQGSLQGQAPCEGDTQDSQVSWAWWEAVAPRYGESLHRHHNKVLACAGIRPQERQGLLVQWKNHCQSRELGKPSHVHQFWQIRLSHVAAWLETRCGHARRCVWICEGSPMHNHQALQSNENMRGIVQKGAC